jgi:L-fucose isomerase-like protein
MTDRSTGSGNVTYEVRFTNTAGATIVGNSASANRYREVRGRFHNVGSVSAQKWVPQTSVSPEVSTASAILTGSLDSSGDIVLVLALTLATGTDVVTIHSFKAIVYYGA